jgi:hypothetical protein
MGRSDDRTRSCDLECLAVPEVSQGSHAESGSSSFGLGTPPGITASLTRACRKTADVSADHRFLRQKPRLQ